MRDFFVVSEFLVFPHCVRTCKVRNILMEANSLARNSSTWLSKVSSQFINLIIFKWVTASIIRRKRSSLRINCSNWKLLMESVSPKLNIITTNNTIVPGKKGGIFFEILLMSLPLLNRKILLHMFVSISSNELLTFFSSKILQSNLTKAEVQGTDTSKRQKKILRSMESLGIPKTIPTMRHPVDFSYFGKYQLFANKHNQKGPSSTVLTI